MGKHITSGNGELPPVEHEDQRAQALGVIAPAPLVLHTMRKKKSHKGKKEKENQCKDLDNRGAGKAFKTFAESPQGFHQKVHQSHAEGRKDSDEKGHAKGA
jgi:hypothetical protein